MGGVADAEEAGAGPLPQAIEGDGEELDVRPVIQFERAARQEGGDGFDAGAEGGETFGAGWRRIRPWGL